MGSAEPPLPCKAVFPLYPGSAREPFSSSPRGRGLIDVMLLFALLIVLKLTLEFVRFLKRELQLPMPRACCFPREAASCLPFSSAEALIPGEERGKGGGGYLMSSKVLTVCAGRGEIK